MRPPESHLRKGPSYSVAVYYFEESGYGGATAASSWKDALAQVESLRKLGYDEPLVSEIHVIRKVVDIWKGHQLTDCRAKLAKEGKE